jgi:hypothetical protein
MQSPWVELDLDKLHLGALDLEVDHIHTHRLLLAGHVRWAGW